MKAAAGAAGRAAAPGDAGGGTAPVPARQMMRAIVQAGYGSAGVLQLAEAGPGQRPLAARFSSGSVPPGPAGAPVT
jgi:hypothetical protein